MDATIEPVAVIFDVGGVLNMGSDNAKYSLAERLNLSKGQIDDIWSNHAQPLSVGEIDEEEFWRRVRRGYPGIPRAGAGTLGANYARSIDPNREVLRLTRELCSQAKGLTVGILSNTLPPHAAALRRHGIYDGFSPVILSCDRDVCLRKPDRRIFGLLLRQLGNPEARRVVLIDDSKVNIDTARLLGFQAVRYSRRVKLREALRKLGIDC